MSLEEKKLPVEMPGDAESAQGHGVVTHQDAVFGEITEKGPNYRSLGWIGTSGLMMKTQIGLGVLSFPSVFDTLGMIPGVIILLFIGALTTWSNYIVGVFKLRHRHIYGIDDVGMLLFGRVGKEVLAFVFMGFYVMTAGSAMLSISIALNALSEHGACTAVFVAVAFVAVMAVASVRTLGRIAWLAMVGVVCIIIAVFVVVVGVGVQDRPAAAPEGVHWQSDYKLVGNPSFLEAIAAISNIVFAYAGTGAFFSIVSEMEDPRLYTRALALCQSIVSLVYLVVAVVVYYFCGSYVTSPAPGSAGPTIKKVSYGIGLPGLFVSGVLLGHVSSKYMFVRILRGSKHLTSNTFIHWSTWLGCVFGVCTVAYILASAIPVFNGIVGLAGALFGTLLCFQPMGAMWLYDNWAAGKANPTMKWRLMVAWCVFVIVSGTFIMVAGSYGAISGIYDSYHAQGGTAAWSCADNSGSS